MNTSCVGVRLKIIVSILSIMIIKNNVNCYVDENSDKRAIGPETIERVFRIADEIGRYSESVPNLFRVVKRNLEDLEREVKLSAMLPSRTKLEAFRMISEPLNRFLKQGPKEYYIHNPPRGTAYNQQMKKAREAVREVYSELQGLWLTEH